MSNKETDVFICQSVEDVKALVNLMLIRTDIVAFDTETTAIGRGNALDYRYYECLCVSFTMDEGESWVVPFRCQIDKDETGKLKIDRKTGEYKNEDLPHYWKAADELLVLDELRRFFASNIKAVAQNGKFDLGVLHKMGIFVQNYTDDTLLLHALIDENSPHNLEHLRAAYTPLAYYEGWKADSSIITSQNFPYAVVPDDTLRQYAGADTDVTLRAYNRLRMDLEQEGSATQSIYKHISMPLAKALFQIERTGVLIDVPRMMHVQAQYQQWISESETLLFDAIGHRFPYSSNAAKVSLLYNELQLPVIKRTPGGQPSTDKDTLTMLMQDTENPVLGLLLKLSRLQKQRNTYLAGEDGKSGLSRWLDSDGRVHTTYNQTPRTGRLSSSEPNLQNITKDDAAKEFIGDDDDDPKDLIIRTIFCAPKGHYLVEIDFSQLELRIQERVTREPVLTAAFANGGEADIHSITASGIYEVSLNKVTKDQRAIGKRSNFALGYQGGKFAVQRATKLPINECERIVLRYKDTYAATTQYQRKIANLLMKQGYIENAFGRKRHFPTYTMTKNSSRTFNSPARDQAWKDAAHMERQGYNHIMQSTGSDCLSLSTIDLVLHTPELVTMGAVCCLTLHDALYWYVPIPAIDDFLDIVHNIMENVAKDRGLDWTLPVDSVWGARWGEEIGKRKGARL